MSKGFVESQTFAPDEEGCNRWLADECHRLEEVYKSAIDLCEKSWTTNSLKDHKGSAATLK